MYSEKSRALETCVDDGEKNLNKCETAGIRSKREKRERDGEEMESRWSTCRCRCEIFMYVCAVVGNGSV